VRVCVAYHAVDYRGFCLSCGRIYRGFCHPRICVAYHVVEYIGDSAILGGAGADVSHQGARNQTEPVRRV